MPDIDIDFCYERRQEVIDYVTRKYGEDRVCQIITLNHESQAGRQRCRQGSGCELWGNRRHSQGYSL